MTTNLIGTITDLFPLEVYGSFEKRVIWLKQNDPNMKYPQTWAVEFHQGEAQNLDPYKTGDVVKCYCEILGRRWDKNGKTGVIVSLKCKSIAKATAEDINQGKPAPFAQAAQSNNIQPIDPGPADDLPF